MNKIICFIFGHKSIFKKVDGHRYFKNGRECKRCKITLYKTI